jgi:hypothetical protein
MDIDKEKAVEDFKNFMELPILGKALYMKMRQYKDLISANIEEFSNIVELRNLVKKNIKEWPKSSNDHEFEIVNVNGIWIPVLPGDNDIEASRMIPEKLVSYIVKEAGEMDSGIILRKNNLTLTGIKGRVFNLWFEKLRDDYIYGIIKTTIAKAEPNYIIDVDDTIIKELKNIDYDKMFEIFRLMFEKGEFREEIFKIYNVWKNVLEENAQSTPGISHG